MGWNGLLHEVVTIIFLNLIKNNQKLPDHYQNLPDLYQCLAVSRSWRNMAKRCLFNIAPSPWLLLTHKYPDDQTITFTTTICKFHNTTRRAPETKLSFHLIDHTKAYACYDGWLLLGYDNKDFSTSTVFLYNPLSDVLLQLPPFPGHLWLKDRDTVKFVISESCPTNRDCVICVNFLIGGNSVLAFCKPAPSDDGYASKARKKCLFSSSSAYWVVIDKDISKIEDMVFLHGKLYTIDRFGALSVYNYDANAGVYTGKCVIVDWLDMFNSENVDSQRRVPNRNYNSLLKSKSGDLLMIKRIFCEKYARVTVACRIFKMNMSNLDYYFWSEISNLEEKEALFFGWDECLSVSISDYNPTFKPNCIYFFDKYASSGEVIRYGVYDLKTRTFLSYSDDNGVDRDAKGYQCCRLFAPSGLS